ncbi:aminodeoxychorismate/anthranilate synthase component II [Staphylococcus sp. SQ8-PEA]|uniref:Aminodeoxychorismate/anthranilate synthase component II n=1 Tax=Staphylococcus marylandisciuri TaxID=2981529 RepID=A0ABT2QP99_9STAP|nr:aminodeoxychorismate/anthranilate synthase component II [Staphylococcus marylandisciuri]MCU5745800.1 aminodeoxychorismate/anthranilate synthase component II [Staphylococcus marylandisciuri]
MLVVIDNQDSFTYNLVDLLACNTHDSIRVVNVARVSVPHLKSLNPEAIVISPGPGRPEDYPILFEVIEQFEHIIPILGVCLGFQLIVQYYGGHIIHSYRPVHGHTTSLKHDGSGLFNNLPQDFSVMRYHSLMIDLDCLPHVLRVTAYNEENVAMAINHRELPIFGVQYHPESILSEFGAEQVKLFLARVGESHADPV